MPRVHSITRDATSALIQGPQFHLVISHYKENPDWVRKWVDSVRTVPSVQKLGIKVIVYAKHREANADQLRAAIGADEVHVLPNLGREGATFLYHLTQVCNNPPLITAFTQAGITDQQANGSLSDWLLDRLNRQVGPDTGFLTLAPANFIMMCACSECEGYSYPFLPQIYSTFKKTVCPPHEYQTFSYKGQFIASRKRILASTCSAYEQLHELLTAPQDHWIHREEKPTWYSSKDSTPDTPKFGHTVERAWHAIFNCTEAAIQWTCADFKDGGFCGCRDS